MLTRIHGFYDGGWPITADRLSSLSPACQGALRNVA